MIYEKYDQEFKACKYPDASSFKAKRWEEFTKTTTVFTTPVPHNIVEIKNFIKELEADHHEGVKAEIAKMRSDCDTACKNITKAFKADLERTYIPGGLNHPRAEKLWSLAWEYGHSAGYCEVEGYYTDMAQLLV